MVEETHLILILVDHRTVDVPVARTNRRLDLMARRSSLNTDPPSNSNRTVTYRILDFIGLREPGPEANLGDLLAAGELHGLPEGHGVGQWGRRGGKDEGWEGWEGCVGR